MRTIGTIPRQLDAERFSDYLLAQGMPNMVEESGAGGGGEWLVWVEDDDHLDRAKAELDQYRANPSDPRYNGAGKRAEDIRAAKEKKQKRLAKNFVDVRTNWGSARQWAVPVTLALMVVSCAVALATQLGRNYAPVGTWLAVATATPEQAAALRDAAAQEGLDPDEVRLNPRMYERQLPQVTRGQVWRLVTPIFLHFGILHLVFNLFWLRDLGAMVETQRGSIKLLALVLGVATISNLVQYYWSGSPYFGGMSGVNYGLLGYVWMKMRFEPHQGLGISPQGLLIMMVWLVVCAIGLIPGVANAAHVAGLAVGAAAGYAPTGWRRVKRSLGR